MATYSARNIVFGPGGKITPAVKALLIANGAIFLLQAFGDRSILFIFGLVPALVWQKLYLWQLLTYQFLHGGIFHLVFHMLALWMFGCDLERRWGSGFFLKYYNICVAGGALLNVLFLPYQSAPSIGASAGIYGILLAYGLLYPERIVYFYFLFPMKMKYFVLIIGAISLYLSTTAGASGIAHLAHLGGMAFGYVYLRWRNPLVWLRIYWDQLRLARRKRRFGIVEGGKRDSSKPTLH
ncbi:MAG TPA: rhomboid family intramembrane serine protease [Candidatus Acidoferrales bacterium]|nr:rhomboid family intramembrane serine protease [Candidatus Acidoferrales bacterium]